MTQKQKPIESGTWIVLKIGTALTTITLMVYFVYSMIQHGTIVHELSGFLTILFCLVLSSLLIFIPKLQKRFQQSFLYLILFFITLASISLPMLFFSARNSAEVAVSLWMLTFSVFIPLSVIAIQLQFTAAFVFVILVNFIEIGLQIHAAQTTDIMAYLHQYHILTVVLVRILVMVSMGHILSLLVKAYHDNQAKLQSANLELESLNHDLELHVMQRTTALNDTNQKTLEGWVRLLELRNYESRGHSERVCRLSTALAERLNRSTEEIEAVKYGAMLHDIGALGIPDPVLLKIEPLTALDWEIIRRHSEYGYQILQGIEFLEPSLDIVHYHHERIDGSGYPNGLKGNAIPWSARLFAVVDVYDSLTSKRPYRAAWTIRDAKNYLKNNAGLLFDPLMVTAFLGLLETEELDHWLDSKLI